MSTATRVDAGDRYLSEEIKPRPTTCQCGKWTPVEDDREVRCLVCGRPSPRTRRLQAR